MIIPFCEIELDNWGSWVRHDERLGYRSVTFEGLLMKYGQVIRGTNHKEPENPRAEVIDRLIRKLIPVYRNVLILKYIFGYFDYEIARIIKVSRKTISGYVENAHHYIYGALTGNAATA